METIENIENIENTPLEERIAIAENDTEIVEEAPQKEEATPDPEIIISSLNEKISALEAELNTYKEASERQSLIAEQINEFNELFPEIAVRSVPDEVWESVKKGNTLAAAYSVYERRITEAARKIELINQRNASTAAGAAGKSAPKEYFSTDEVRKMSPAEVRANYAGIRRSMEKWN
jgi:hypothetical protein